MKHRVLTTIAAAALACAALAGSASAAAGKGIAFQFRGELKSASSTSVELQVEGGNHAALRALLGQSQDQTFTVGDKTEFLLWSQGVPKVVSYSDLKAGDWVQVTVRAKAGSSLSDVESTDVGIVGDHVTQPNPPSKPLYLFVGTVAGPQSGGHIQLEVKAGNRRALRAMIGQSSTETFTYDDQTIFLLWQGKVPTVIDPSQLKAGDRITIRVRADVKASLADVESTPAVHVGDHEPASGLSALPTATSATDTTTTTASGSDNGTKADKLKALRQKVAKLRKELRSGKHG